jgi:type I site-specific restriction-modification system R (restriction) subunit
MSQVLVAWPRDWAAGGFWHTQGLGTSQMMWLVTPGGITHRTLMESTTLVVLNDRSNLADQTFGISLRRVRMRQPSVL